MATMQAALVRAHGGPEMLEPGRIERPAPATGEILVRVGACALNHLDVFVRRGMPGVRLQLPHVPGSDVAGWVEATRGGTAGDDNSASLVGAAVLLDPIVGQLSLGEHLPGGLAEYVVAPAANAIRLPDGATDLARYAALPTGYATAYHMLFARAGLKQGETVAVLGAAGGVGVACVQFAHRAGARVIACSSSDEKLARLRALGADETIDTAREDFSRRVWELTGKQGADVVVDFNGRDTWPGSLRCTRRNGRLVTCGATSGFEAVTDLRYVWTRELQIMGSNGWERGELESIAGTVARGELDPVIHGVFPLSQARAALAEIEERRALGKVIVVPDAVLHAS